MLVVGRSVRVWTPVGFSTATIAWMGCEVERRKLRQRPTQRGTSLSHPRRQWRVRRPARLSSMQAKRHWVGSASKSSISLLQLDRFGYQQITGWRLSTKSATKDKNSDANTRWGRDEAAIQSSVAFRPLHCIWRVTHNGSSQGQSCHGAALALAINNSESGVDASRNRSVVLRTL